MEQVWAPCSSCTRQTRHNVLHSVDHSNYEFGTDVYQLIECAGCQSISLFNFYGDGFEAYYPSPVRRRRPDWMQGPNLFLSGRISVELFDLIDEIYQAMTGGQKRLAAMGIRALLEQVMISKVGDRGSFHEHLDLFHAAGFVSLLQRDQLKAILDVGHAAMHRSHQPTDHELSSAMDMVEGIIASIFVHPEVAEKLAERVPPRPPRQKPTGSNL